MDSASPRISGGFAVVEDSSSAMVRNFSRWVWMENVPGVLGVEIQRKDSSGEMASWEAERMPNLSQLRYLDRTEF